MKYILILLFLINSIYGYNKNIETRNIYKQTKLSWLDLRNKNLVSQKFDYSCGSASLATIFKYFYNKNISESDILETILADNKELKEKNGNILFSFLDLANVAIKNKFKTFSLELDFSTLKKLKIPAILYIIIRKEAHFTVFRAIDNNYIYLADPSFGNIKISLEKFKEMFKTNKNKGKLLLIIPKDKIALNYEFMNIERRETSFFERSPYINKKNRYKNKY